MGEIDDPVIHEATAAARKALASNDEKGAMLIMRELTKHLLAQAYAIPRPKRGNINLWWPWMKNYQGELYLGYAPAAPPYIWLDQALKKEMGY